jgi:putative membrane protein
MRRPIVTPRQPWLLLPCLSALALGIPACGDDDTDTTPADGGAESAGHGGASSAGKGGTSGRGGSGSALAGSGGTSAAAGSGKSGSGGSGLSTAGAGGKSSGSSGSSGSVSAIKLTDAQIASVLLTANQGEAAQNTLASGKTTNTDVRALANDFADAHTAAANRETALYAMLNLTPADNAVSSQLRDTSDSTITQLQNASASQFDLTFVNGQISEHQAVLILIDQNLLVNVTNDALRSEVTAIRTAVQSHLAEAEALLTKIQMGGEDAGVDAGI